MRWRPPRVWLEHISSASSSLGRDPKWQLLKLSGTALHMQEMTMTFQSVSCRFPSLAIGFLSLLSGLINTQYKLRGFSAILQREESSFLTLSFWNKQLHNLPMNGGLRKQEWDQCTVRGRRMLKQQWMWGTAQASNYWSNIKEEDQKTAGDLFLPAGRKAKWRPGLYRMRVWQQALLLSLNFCFLHAKSLVWSFQLALTTSLCDMSSHRPTWQSQEKATSSEG